ncbi:putative uncharacterized transporter YgaY like protein [Verticillium longisporum]|uniref:Uncharacterized transporter YgaY like protein n=1 Tax=Verticillium longisporum TaxID=100787 RepID=A0A8I3AXW2_VERLO|nr:putative uncharacterized transporter YgaY like protein [Verticillium longisporum]
MGTSGQIPSRDRLVISMAIFLPSSKDPAGFNRGTEHADAVFEARVAESDKPDDRSPRGLVIHILTWTPTRLRYNPANPPKFGYSLNFLYALSATITVANLYYNQPVLNRIAETFNVSFERASSVATLMQSGYAAGLLFLCPLGDTLRRRPFIIGLWLGLCVTKSFEIFCALSFICGATTVTPQLMIPLVGDIAPPQRKTTAMAIVASGLMFGMLVARLLSVHPRCPALLLHA